VRLEIVNMASSSNFSNRFKRTIGEASELRAGRALRRSIDQKELRAEVVRRGRNINTDDSSGHLSVVDEHIDVVIPPRKYSNKEPGSKLL